MTAVREALNAYGLIAGVLAASNPLVVWIVRQSTRSRIYGLRATWHQSR